MHACLMQAADRLHGWALSGRYQVIPGQIAKLFRNRCTEESGRVHPGRPFQRTETSAMACTGQEVPVTPSVTLHKCQHPGA